MGHGAGIVRDAAILVAVGVGVVVVGVSVGVGDVVVASAAHPKA